VTPVVAAAAPLVLDRQRSVTTRRECPTPRVVHGVKYRCRKRSCGYCMGRKNRVLGRMLVSDAVLDPPTHVMTLTTADPDMPSQRFTRGVSSVFKRLRRHYGSVEYFLKVEFTTGKGVKSGGHRRIHGHLCVKGLAGADLIELERMVRETWEASTGAVVVEVAEMVTPAGALHYLGIHHGKLSQQPPDDWRGMTERFSKGYLRGSVLEARREAEGELWAEGLAWSTGLSPSDAFLLLRCREAERSLLREKWEAARAELAELVTTVSHNAAVHLSQSLPGLQLSVYDENYLLEGGARRDVKPSPH